MLSQEIRRKFLNYFKEKGHTLVSSAPVIPHDDPTILFNNAGMNQFKDVFLGKNTRDYTRATSTQKCIRVGGKHNDLDNVGHTRRHLTFFEMLGNFSFGDYFKKEAISFAWEVALNVFELPKEKIWITIFEEDNEAFDIWKEIAPVDRIVRMGAKDNFWAMGETGPCGPCSELLYDRGPDYGDAENPRDDASGERFLEFWNLVFMQYNRDASGKIHPLPNKSIDTGAGLERIVALKLDVDNLFHTDILQRLVQEVEKISGVKYTSENAATFHVIADHIRSLSFAIADGAQPSNIERGYVLRKLLRRAVRYGRGIGLEEPFLAKLLPPLVEMMGDDFPELKRAESRIAEILTLEEEGFQRTLKRGGDILSDIVEKAKSSPLKQITGEAAFKLKDTYGFPLEEILLIAKDAGLEVNIDAYQLLEEKAREMSRSAHVATAQEAEESLFKHFAEKESPCHFVGYSDTEVSSSVIGLIRGGKLVDSLAGGEEGGIILQSTPFYAEKGGQVGDTGIIHQSGNRFVVSDTKNPYPGIILHQGIVEEGTVKLGDTFNAQIDAPRRKRIAIHHTATHILHWALQELLGGHIKQAGSLVEPNRLRFDFNHHKALTTEQLRELEDLINEKIRSDQAVNTYEIPFEEAQRRGEIKQFFGEKYGAHVRVVDIDFSKELCGGTHAAHVGMIGYFRITKESSIAAGVRRIEAVCGAAAEQFARAEEQKLIAAAEMLKTQPQKVLEKIGALVDENEEQKLQLKNLRRGQIKEIARALKDQMESVGKIPFLAREVEIDGGDLALLAEQLPEGVVILGVKEATKAQIFVRVSPSFVKQGIKAGSIVKEIAPLIGGGGGGRPEQAQAGGKNPEGLSKAFEKAKTLIQ